MHLGIDLGTSNSAIVGNTGDGLRVFKTADGTDVLPSVVFIDGKGHRWVGRRAYEQAAVSPDNVAVGVKRIMGTSTSLRFVAADLSLTPEEVSAEILRTLLSQVELEVGQVERTGTIVTIPAAFNQMQTEATIRAAELAGLRSVGLIQEPIAAAMASMAATKSKSGQFLVYDLGGGTFDAALVQSSAGTVSIIGHEGRRMLGGRDFDSAIVSDLVLPWLESQFTFGGNIHTEPKFERMMNLAKLRAEQAKIELSSHARTTLFVSGDETRMSDAKGTEVYIDVEIKRDDLERLVLPRIDESIDVCAALIAEHGFRSDDIDRVVLIGGPSKMPVVRSRVAERLGVPVDLATDPMIAVAIGASIFAESRDWGTSRTTTRKASRASKEVGEITKLRFDYPSRTSSETARLRVTASDISADLRIRVTSDSGWASGDVPVKPDMKLELPLGRIGENRFVATVIGSIGPAQPPTDLVITKTYASAAGVPVTQTLAVAIERDVGGTRREELDPLITKGTLLPTTGRSLYRSARKLVGGTDDFIDVVVYEQEPGIVDPSVSLRVGSFRLSARTDLDAGEILNQGDEIVVHWAMDDNGLLTCKIEVPALSRTFDHPAMYTPNTGHQNFSGEEGQQFVEALVRDAKAAVDDARSTLGDTAVVEVTTLQSRIERGSKLLTSSNDVEARKLAAEEARAVQQAISRLRSAPQHRGRVLMQNLLELEEVLETVLREGCEEAVIARFEQIGASARKYLDEQQIDSAEACINQMRDVVFRELLRRPDFLVHQFESLASERYLSADKGLHDRLIAEGRDAINQNDADRLRSVNGQLLSNHFTVAGRELSAAKLVGIMKGV